MDKAKPLSEVNINATTFEGKPSSLFAQTVVNYVNSASQYGFNDVPYASNLIQIPGEMTGMWWVETRWYHPTGERKVQWAFPVSAADKRPIWRRFNDNEWTKWVYFDGTESERQLLI